MAGKECSMVRAAGIAVTAGILWSIYKSIRDTREEDAVLQAYFGVEETQHNQHHFAAIAQHTDLAKVNVSIGSEAQEINVEVVKKAADYCCASVMIFKVLMCDLRAVAMRLFIHESASSSRCYCATCGGQCQGQWPCISSFMRVLLLLSTQRWRARPALLQTANRWRPAEDDDLQRKTKG